MDQYTNLTELLKGSKKTLFYVAVVFVDEMGRVLLGERKEDGIWTTPAGGAEMGETPEQAAVREVFEETGMTIAVDHLEPIAVKATPNGKPIHCFMYRTNAPANITLRLDPDKEVHGWDWYDRHSIPHGMSRQKNVNRLETVNQALMRFHGIGKSMEDSNVLSLVDKLNKGGPGSGIEGHMTARKPSPLHPPVKAPLAAPINKLGAHLQALEHGAVMPGINTQSGKPVVNDMDAARAHGYDVQDHVDAMNAHYELAQKTSAILEKLRMAGHKVPEEGKKIAKFHEKKMKEHMNARQHLEQRKVHTAAALKEKKEKAVASVKKSTTQMGGGLGDRDLDIGSFAQANGQGHAEWMEKLYSGMEGFTYGDDPREFETDKGKLHIAKVDDGLYSGFFTKKDDDGLLDNAKVRMERLTVPELVQFMIAKEWIGNHMVDEVKEPEPAPAPMPALPDPYVALNSTLEAPMPPPPVPNIVQYEMNEQRIRMLELVNKLMG